MRGVLLGSLLLCAGIAAVLFISVLGKYISLPVFNFFTPEDQQLVLFTGDVFLGRAVERWWKIAPANQTPFTYVESLFGEYEHVVINFESAVPKQHVPTPDYTFRFSVAAKVVETLPTFNITHASLANNHGNDFGSAGVANARAVFGTSGITPLGSPNTVDEHTVHTVQAGDVSVALVSVNTVGVPLSLDEVFASIDAVRETHDFVMVYVHWGTEYQPVPDTIQAVITETLVEAQVDVVIGHHPHVVQPVERVGDTIVFYSLGNTVFDQYFSEAVQEGLLVGFGRVRGEYGLTLYPVSSISSPHQPRLLEAEDRQLWLDIFAETSSESLADAVKNGFIPLQ